MAAATATFLHNGYLGTSMDEIAMAAGVSKQTIYKQFVSKEQLFAQIVLDTMNRLDPSFQAGIVALGATTDVKTDLRKLARQLIRIVMESRLIRLRRVVIGEASRFPDLGRTYYERGPGRTADALTSQFQRLAKRGLLRLDDPRLAAQHFIWLVHSIPLNRAMFYAGVEFTAAELKHYADEAVRVFLAAYGKTPWPLG